LIHVFCATIAFEEAGDDTLEFPHNRDIGKQLAAKQILLLMSKADQNLDKSLLINRDSLCNRRSFQAGELASLIDFNEENTTKTVPVLIGWITYDTRWIGDVGNTLLDRVGTIAKVLKSISKLCLFPTMPCKGFFHELKQHAFGLVYEIPTVQSLAMELHDPAYISSLNTLIETTKNVRHRPPLEHIYELASNLSVALLEFHKVGWLHKSLSSYCILIPRAIEVSGDVRVLNFYICGFNYSRSDRPDEYSHGLCEKTDRAALYHHPDYRQGKSRYCRSFDRYSLGLLLLELGLWKPLHEMRVGMNSGKSTTDKSHPAPVKGESEVQTEDPSEFSRHILRQFVPLLGPRMGSRYKKAVMHFLSGVEVLEEPDLLSFESECVNELKRCLQNES
jgi:hypothetical protein